ncbi:mediator of RNA polymerase II transcription subunit 20 [Octopus bimaculoides]|uniref:Mediator of RNA polymerase II transcription subunit 20 n=1 Tax=Octopus bimaculoides TaxID=37653 RepID=A0A0L8FFZ0_OCTBM|nr:mediator of RNA polymerase II transcription subunit 20 [Octopus bimaculoides]|eukprot:XP_014790192.1 PREDICTED: mediator of RNA polymerase II transcription subunit 20-like [Octopus bimaculoides]
MGVVCVFSYPVPEGKNAQQIVDSLQKQVELLGAVKAGNFYVDCETYQSTLPNTTTQRLIHILHNSEQPATCFAILDTGNCLVADSQFDVLMQRLKGFYQQRKGSKIESKGQRYEYGDFLIKIGTVLMASSVKGILVEVEYYPCAIINDCWNLMKELIQSVMGNILDNPPATLKNKLTSEYSPSDTVQQYLEHFNVFRKNVSANQSR